MSEANGGMQQQAAANVLQNAAADAVRIAASFAASIKEASMSKGGRKEHLKKIEEFKAFVREMISSCAINNFVTRFTLETRNRLGVSWQGTRFYGGVFYCSAT